MPVEPSAMEHLEACLDRIAEVDRTINAFISVDAAGARRSALASDGRRLHGGVLGPLDGMPVAVKDNIDTAGLRTTIGSGMYADRVPDADADIVVRLRAAGAVIVGKTNMTELACGTVGFNEHFGDVRNPRDTDRYPGGSSSGSAAAVAAGMVPLAIGTDTSASVRQPAASCGVVGLKPTWGRVCNDGVSVCASAADHVGPIANTVTEAAALLAGIQDAGWDDPSRTIGQPVGGLRIGVVGGAFLDTCDADVLRIHETAVRRLSDLGLELTDLDLAVDLEDADEQLNVLCRDLLLAYGEDTQRAPAELIGSELRSWLGLFEQGDSAAYEHAQATRQNLQTVLDGVFAEFDALVCPTARRVAGLYATAVDEAREYRIGNCSLWSFIGVPSLTVPAGLADSGMPVGLLINGRPNDDATVLQLGAALEAAI